MQRSESISFRIPLGSGRPAGLVFEAVDFVLEPIDRPRLQLIDNERRGRYPGESSRRAAFETHSCEPSSHFAFSPVQEVRPGHGDR